jgi:hypothetical protein
MLGSSAVYNTGEDYDTTCDVVRGSDVVETNAFGASERLRRHVVDSVH